MRVRTKTVAAAVVLGGGILVGVGHATSPDAGATGVPVTGPDTTGQAMWTHMQEEEYRETWDLWPGLGEFYRGNDPHGRVLTTYVNEPGRTALESGTTLMPEGTVVIKENYTPDRELVAITVMYKRPGYNPDHNDWFFTKFRPDGSLDRMPNGQAMEGRLPGCQGCHIQRAEQDYLFSPRPGSGGNVTR